MHTEGRFIFVHGTLPLFNRRVFGFPAFTTLLIAVHAQHPLRPSQLLFKSFLNRSPQGKVQVEYYHTIFFFYIKNLLCESESFFLH